MEKASAAKPVAVGGMTREELDKELMKGIESLQFGKVYSVEEVDAELAREFGVSLGGCFLKIRTEEGGAL